MCVKDMSPLAVSQDFVLEAYSEKVIRIVLCAF